MKFNTKLKPEKEFSISGWNCGLFSKIIKEYGFVTHSVPTINYGKRISERTVPFMDMCFELRFCQVQKVSNRWRCIVQLKLSWTKAWDILKFKFDWETVLIHNRFDFKFNETIDGTYMLKKSVVVFQWRKYYSMYQTVY